MLDFATICCFISVELMYAITYLIFAELNTLLC